MLQHAASVPFSPLPENKKRELSTGAPSLPQRGCAVCLFVIFLFFYFSLNIFFFLGKEGERARAAPGSITSSLPARRCRVLPAPSGGRGASCRRSTGEHHKLPLFGPNPHLFGTVGAASPLRTKPGRRWLQLSPPGSQARAVPSVKGIACPNLGSC